MLFLRIKQAEVAVADGRLDEAYDLLQSPRLRDHRQGQALVTRLVEALADRGRAHLAAGRCPEALADGTKAGRLGGNQAGVAELCAAATAALAGRQRADRHAARQLAAARKHVEDGQLSIGEQLLAPLREQESQAAALLTDVAVRRGELDAAIAAAEAALRVGEAERAAAAVGRARELGAADTRLDALAADAGRLLHGRIRDALAGGRLTVADALGRIAADLGGGDVESDQLRRAVAQCRRAWDLLDAGDLRPAEEVVRRVAALFPGATWAADAVRQLRQAHEAIDALRTGPLGLLAAGGEEVAMPSAKPSPATPPPLPAVPARPSALPAGPGAVPSRFLVRVDGVGSFLVLRGSKVSVGPVSSSRLPDLGLVADPSQPVVEIERLDDDYFLRSSAAAVAVNDRSAVGAGGRLLAGGDQLTLSPRCRLVFRLPSPVSTSAVLDLTGCRTPTGDVRRVVLMDRDLLLGPSPNAHIPLDRGGDDGKPAPGAILHVRGGRLVCESKSPVTVDGRPMDRHAGLPVGAQVRAGDLAFVITEV